MVEEKKDQHENGTRKILSQNCRAMLRIKEKRRRAKQKAYEFFRVFEAEDDSEFQAAYEEWKNVVSATRHLQSTWKDAMTATKELQISAAATSVELAAFCQGTPAEDRAIALGQALSGVEKTHLLAFERVFEESVTGEADMRLWQVKEVEANVKRRRTLLLDLHAYQRKHGAACGALDDVQNNNPNSTGGSMFSRRRGKSVAELSADVDTRKAQLEHAEGLVEDVTKWCLTQFQALIEHRDGGTILGGPMTAFYTCQMRLAAATASQMGQIENLFPQHAQFGETLDNYEEEFAQVQAQAGNDLFANLNLAAQGRRTEDNSSFGLPLGTTCPRALADCIEFLGSFLDSDDYFKQAASNQVVQEVRERYNCGDTECLEDLQVHEVMAVMKRFLNDLPESLVPQQFYEDIIQAMNDASDPQEELIAVVEQLPENHLNILFQVLKFLNNLANEGRVGLVQLATWLSPSIIRAPEDISPVRIMQDMQTVSRAMQVLITQIDPFQVPSNPLPPPIAAPPLPAPNRMPPPVPSGAGSSFMGKHMSFSRQSSSRRNSESAISRLSKRVSQRLLGAKV